MTNLICCFFFVHIVLSFILTSYNLHTEFEFRGIFKKEYKNMQHNVLCIEIGSLYFCLPCVPCGRYKGLKGFQSVSIIVQYSTVVHSCAAYVILYASIYTTQRVLLESSRIKFFSSSAHDHSHAQLHTRTNTIRKSSTHSNKKHRQIQHCTHTI